MSGGFSRETRPSREPSERREGANRSRDLSVRRLRRTDPLRDTGELSHEQSDESAAMSHHEIHSEGAQRFPETFDALREQASSSRRVEGGDVQAPLREKAVRNGKEKLKKYKQEFIKYHDEDVDSTMNTFHDDFVTTIIKHSKELGKFTVVSKAKEGGASYQNRITITTGEISGLYNFKRATRGWPLSEVIFHQLQFVMEEAKEDHASFNLKNWRAEGLSNESTISTAKLFLPAGTHQHTFEKGSPGFIALAGTPTAQAKFFLLAQHQKAFHQKEVTSITVERGSDGAISLDYRYDTVRAKRD